MLSYSSLQNKPRIFQSLTGLKVTEFEQLLPTFEQAWFAYVEEHHIQGKTRQRAYGGGRKSQLKDIQDKLLFILVYFRLYPTQELLGFLFGMGQPQAHEWVYKLTQVLNQALEYNKQLPEREPNRLEAVLNQCLSLEFMIDGTERRINRPKNKEAQKEYYSGKKKGHTVKNNVISQRRGKVVFLSDTYEGKKHDKAICDRENYRFPQGSKLWKDSGFQGYEPSGVDTFQPKKKPRKQELTEADKQLHQLLSRERIETNASHWRHQTFANFDASVQESDRPLRR